MGNPECVFRSQKNPIHGFNKRVRFLLFLHHGTRYFWLVGFFRGKTRWENKKINKKTQLWLNLQRGLSSKVCFGGFLCPLGVR